MGRLWSVLAMLVCTLSIFTASQSLSGEALHDFIDKLLDSKSVKNSPPGAPTIITVDMEINSFGNFDEVSMEYEMQIYLRQRWKNDNLTFVEHNESVIITEEQFSHLWSPDVYFPNEKKASLHDISEPNRLVWIEPDGTILFSQRLTLTLNCYMDLSNYPMDSQLCPFHLETYRYPTEYLIFQWREGEPVIIGTEIMLPEVVLEKYTVEERISSYHTGNYSRLTAHFQMSRPVGYFVLQIFVPSLLTVVLSWVSFWIDVHAVPARISVGLLTVLTMTTHSTGFTERLPRVSYIKAIDIWTTTCLGFVVAGLIEFTLVNVLARKYDRDVERKKSASILAAKRSAQANIALTAMTNVNTSNEETPSRIDGDKPLASADFVFMDSNENSLQWSFLRRQKANPAMFVDVISRILFPLAFIIFNFIFWMTYGV